MTAPYSIKPLGDSALVIVFGNEIADTVNQTAHEAARLLRKLDVPDIVDLVPAFASLTVFYDGSSITYKHLVQKIVASLQGLDDGVISHGRVFELPVCYESPYSSDIQRVADHCECSVEDVIALHSQPEYPVFFLGFLPGFAYLGGMLPALITPRKTTPVLKVAAGSVGIAGRQTGIYPMASPGGWQIIGRTPMPLFVPEQSPPVVLSAGDRVRFKPITASEFEGWGDV